MSPNSKGVEILSIGTELLLGNIINTNAQWISEQLSQLGLNHFRQSTVGDNCDRIIKVIQEISKRSNLLMHLFLKDQTCGMKLNKNFQTQSSKTILLA